MKGFIKSKRGVLGFDTVKAVLIALLTLSVVSVAVFLALTSLNNANIFTAGSLGANATTNILGNVTSGTSSFFGYVPTIMILLAVVVIILVISIVIVAVTRFGGGARESL